MCLIKHASARLRTICAPSAAVMLVSLMTNNQRSLWSYINRTSKSAWIWLIDWWTDRLYLSICLTDCPFIHPYSLTVLCSSCTWHPCIRVSRIYYNRPEMDMGPFIPTQPNPTNPHTFQPYPPKTLLTLTQPNPSYPAQCTEWVCFTFVNNFAKYWTILKISKLHNVSRKFHS